MILDIRITAIVHNVFFTDTVKFSWLPLGLRDNGKSRFNKALSLEQL